MGAFFSCLLRYPKPWGHRESPFLGCVENRFFFCFVFLIVWGAFSGVIRSPAKNPKRISAKAIANAMNAHISNESIDLADFSFGNCI